MSASRTTPVVFQAVVPGSHSGVRITLKNGNAVTLTRSGYTYTTSLPAAQVLAGYQQANMHNLVGYLDVFDGGTRTSRRNLIVNVRDATMPNVHVTKLSADMVASTHVVNMRDDELYWDGDIAPEVVRKFYNAFPDNFDFLAIVHQVDVGERHYVRVQNATPGLGIGVFNNAATYGTARLQGIVEFPIADYFDLAEKAALHEIGHRWMGYLNQAALRPGQPHWPISELAYGIMGWSNPSYLNEGLNFPFKIIPQPTGDYLLQDIGEAKDFNKLELYLMGLIPKDQVGSFLVFTNQAQSGQLTPGGTLHGPVQAVSISDIIAVDGERPLETGKEFRVATIILSAGRLLSQNEMAFFDYMAARGEATTELPYTAGLASGIAKPLRLATGGRAWLNTHVQ